MRWTGRVPLVFTEKKLSSEYKKGSKSNIESVLSKQQSPLPTPLPLLPSLLQLALLTSPPSYTMSQCSSINFELLAQQQ